MAHVPSMLDPPAWPRILSNETLDIANVTSTDNDTLSATLQAPTWLLILLCVLNGVAIAITVASYAFLHMYRNRPIVAIGQTRLLRVLCVGALLAVVGNTIDLTVYSSAWQKSDGNFICSLSYWSPYLGLITVFAIQLLKTYRVLKVSRFRRGLKIPPSRVYGPFAAIVLIGVGVLVAYEVLFPLKFYLADFPDSDQQNHRVPHTFDIVASVVFPMVMMAINLVLNIGILVFACKAKNLDQELGDSRRIFISLLIVFVLEIPNNLLFFLALDSELLKLGTLSRYSMVVATTNLRVIYASVVPVMCLIVPRMYYLWYEHRHGHLPNGVREFGRGSTRVTVNNYATPATNTTAATNSTNNEEAVKDKDATTKTSPEDNALQEAGV